MFKDKSFNMSLLFSFLWHLFWISVVVIIITPSVQSSNLYQEVDFLGPILEKTAFDLMVEEAIPQTETLYTQANSFLNTAQLKPEGPKRRVLKEFSLDRPHEKLTLTLNADVKNTKEIPRYFSEETQIIAREERNQMLTPYLGGPALKREVIFKPQLPLVPRGFYGDMEEYVVKLKFFVSNNGIVYDVEPIVSSGYPEVDLQAMRFLKKWRFSSLNTGEQNESTWGTLILKIDTK